VLHPCYITVVLVEDGPTTVRRELGGFSDLRRGTFLNRNRMPLFRSEDGLGISREHMWKQEMLGGREVGTTEEDGGCIDVGRGPVLLLILLS
jgi:hypothetical protein